MVTYRRIRRQHKHEIHKRHDAAMALLLSPQLLLLLLALLPYGINSLSSSAPPSSLLHLEQHPSIQAISAELRPRSRLKPHHAELFTENDNSIVSRLGCLCCQAGVVSRKEFCETLAAAQAIDEQFPDIPRVADLAAGHGLLGWFLLALNENRTVISVDRIMPPAAQKIAVVMEAELPADRWTYVEGDLQNCVPHPSCLLASVHACGNLTDSILQMGIDFGAPVAVVPCCHSLKPDRYRELRVGGQASQPPMSYSHMVKAVEQRKQQYTDKHLAVADVVDQVRCKTLQHAGFNVQQIQLPADFMGRNRLIAATPQGTEPLRTTERVHGIQESSAYIPLANDAKSIARCCELSSKQRTKDRMPQSTTNRQSFTLAMSLWTDPPTNGTDAHSTRVSCFSALTACELQKVIDEICATVSHDDVPLQCSVTASGDLSTMEGRRSQLFQFQYTRFDGKSMKGSPRIQAKVIHRNLKECIRLEFGEDVVR